LVLLNAASAQKINRSAITAAYPTDQIPFHEVQIMLTLIRFAVKVFLLMVVLPALGLLTFHGGVLSGIGVSLLTAVIGTVATILLLPVILTVGLGSILGAGVVAGRVGMWLAGFGIGTLVYSLTLWVVALIVPTHLALLGFWPTFGAAAILGLAASLLTPHVSTTSAV